MKPYTVNVNQRVIPSIEGDRTSAQQQDMSPIRGGQPSKDKKNSVILADAARQAGLRAINYGIGQYGNLTGDYLTGQNIQQLQNVYQIVSGATSVAGVLGAAMAVGAIVLNEVVQYNRNMENVNMMRQRAGVLMSGGRYTDE